MGYLFALRNHIIFNFIDCFNKSKVWTPFDGILARRTGVSILRISKTVKYLLLTRCNSEWGLILLIHQQWKEYQYVPRLPTLDY